MQNTATKITSKVLLEDYRLDMFVGCSPAEKLVMQRVFISVSASVNYDANALASDDLTKVVSYLDFIEIAKTEAAKGHIQLVETFASRIAVAVLERLPLVQTISVTIRKPDIIPDAKAVGCTIAIERNTCD